MRPNGNEDTVLGRRIVVWGMTGSGKTTLARSLGGALGLGVIELDAIRHARGWDSVPWEEFRAVLTRRLASHPEGWVTDGSYSAIMDVYLPHADTVIWLHPPWRVSFWRLLQRTLRRVRSGDPPYPDSPARESLWKSIFSRDSILWWSIHHHRAGVRSVRRRIAALPPSVRVYELQSPREVEAVLEVAAAPGSRRMR